MAAFGNEEIDRAARADGFIDGRELRETAAFAFISRGSIATGTDEE